MKVRGILLAALLLAGCGATRIENGVYHSPNGYQLSLPGPGWTVKRGGRAELELERRSPEGGMLADATCDGKTAGQPLSVLARHLTFGLGHRETVETVESQMGGWKAERTVVRGTADGAPVAVEAVVLKGERCVVDFVYVAPADAFEAGRGDFQAFVGSFTETAR